MNARTQPASLDADKDPFRSRFLVSSQGNCTGIYCEIRRAVINVRGMAGTSCMWGQSGWDVSFVKFIDPLKNTSKMGASAAGGDTATAARLTLILDQKYLFSLSCHQLYP